MKEGNWWKSASDEERRKLALRAIDMAEGFQRRVNADLEALQAVCAVLSSVSREIEGLTWLKPGDLLRPVYNCSTI